ncbi:hypothetical protein SAY86_001373 [Trapa natans]|uniref:CNH domain-containing protein n=1 Tax=Trapa natans TaxID=22666 RepID=A0AAN7MVX5_TRANT|nr:hypothetical protein SAY86_001373 [Trapa natans]
MAVAKFRTVVESLAQLDLSTAAPSIQISSIVASTSSDSQTLIYIGTQSGSLILLRFAADSKGISFLRSLSIVQDSPVESVHVLSETGRVLLLANGFLFLVDRLLSQPSKKVAPLKGVTAIAPRCMRPGGTANTVFFDHPAETTGTSSRILRKLGNGIRANGMKVRESDQSGRPLGGDCVFAVVVSKRLILGELNSLSGSFVMLKEIQAIDGIRTLVWVDDSIIVGNDNDYSLFSCVSGQSGIIFRLPDSSSPPMLKLLRKEWRVLLTVDNVGVMVDSNGQPAGGSLVFRHGLDSIAEVSSCVAVARDGKMDVYHKKSGGCIQTVMFAGEDVGHCLITQEDTGNGNFVFVATPTKVFCYLEVPYEDQIKELLRKKNFKETISLVEELEQEDELPMDVLSFVHAQVGFLLLFDLHFEEAVNHFLQSNTMQPSEVFPFIMRDPNRWSLLVPRNRYWGLHPPPSPLEDVVDSGLATVQRALFLRKAGVDTAVDDHFLLNPPNRADLLESAIKNIIRYLEVSREKDLTLSVKEGVDTLLMYLYRALNLVDKMENLASSENSCVIEELETLLDETGHLRTLAFLYANRGMSSKALAIWRILSRNYSSGPAEVFKVNNCLTAEVAVLSSREIAAAEASNILEESSDQDLILQHFGWIADIDQLLAVKILTSEKRERKLSPAEVLASIDPKKVAIRQRYLQWLIEEQDSNDAQFHEEYARSLAKSALETIEKEMSGMTSGVNPGEMSTNETEADAFFESPIRERLQIFLQSSDLYDPWLILGLIENSELWLEKAILYRKLGQETLVLEILALKLEDSEAAEQYCAEIGRPDAYMQLLDMYLDPQDGTAPMFKAAVRLLHNHGESLDPLQVLEKLSPEMPLQLASDTILRMLRARLHHHRQGQIVHNLSQAVDIDTRLAVLEERSRHVQINDESLCDSCHARLGTKLFAMYPDDTIVCYKCFRRQGESTSVTGRDFKKDVLIKPGWLVTR